MDLVPDDYSLALAHPSMPPEGYEAAAKAAEGSREGWGGGEAITRPYRARSAFAATFALQASSSFVM